jgi:hypothetical protein
VWGLLLTPFSHIAQTSSHVRVEGMKLGVQLNTSRLTLTEFSSLDIGRMEIDRIISLMHRTDIDRMHNDPFRY